MSLKNPNRNSVLESSRKNPSELTKPQGLNSSMGQSQKYRKENQTFVPAAPFSSEIKIQKEKVVEPLTPELRPRVHVPEEIVAKTSLKGSSKMTLKTK